jgi:Tfp pilus assembly protein PilN
MLSSLTQINACTGVSILLSGKGIRVSALGVLRNGKQLDLTKKIKNKPDLASVMAELPARSVVSLNITGKGVLHKEVEGSPDGGTELFARLMPGADPEAFYFQRFTSGDHTFISIIRKADTDPYIQQLTEKGFQVIMLSIGAFSINPVLEQLNQYGEEFIFDGHEVTFNEQKQWKSYRFKEESRNKFPVKLGIDEIDEQLLLPYAAAFQAILYDQVDVVEANADAVHAQMEDLRQIGLLKRKSVVVMVLAFILLFANTLFLMQLNTDNGRLQDELSLHSTQASDVSALAGKTAKTEELVKAIGYSKAPSKAVILDEVTALMPPEIRLSLIELNPAAGRRSSNTSAQVFSDRRLVISGTCTSILPVNEWLARIRSLKWASQAGLRDYGLSNEEENGAFTIIINF